MTRTRRYGIGLGIAAVIGVVAVALAPAPVRATLALALMIGFLVQGPLGWLVARAVGTDGLLGIWGFAMLVRLGAIAVAGFGAYGVGMRSVEVFLIGIVATMFGLLLVEVGALLMGQAE